ncbi:guanylate kinase [Clostridia bacterium]|nr:guanylate kinase [Clostridia bacterium]
MKGLLVVLSAPAGCGKDTVLERVLSEEENLEYSVSTTTRKPRVGEVDGVHYNFVDVASFEYMLKSGELLEYTNYVGNYYGTPRGTVEKRLDSGKDVVLKIEIEGAMNVRRLFPETVMIFMKPPSVEVLRERLRKRGTETPDVIEKRVETAARELLLADKYDYVVVNDILSDAVRDVRAILRAERLRTFRLNA